MNRRYQIEPLAAPRRPIVNAMSVDVEEYFQVSAFEQHVDFDRWAKIPSRVEESVDRILALFATAGVQATFFTLGWIAERHGAMVRRIASAGHEIASHGMNHVRAFKQDRATFFADVTRSRKILEDVSGQAIKGYRAASFSIGEANLWALETLAEAGYTYSSSIYPGAHDAYGIPGAPRFAFRTAADGLLEIPVTTAEIRGRRFPCAGGGFFRLYPYWVTQRALRRVNERDARAALFYFHPWEVDPGQPRVSGVGLKSRARHYLNLHRVEPRLRRLLSDFRWDRMDRVFPVAPSSSEPTVETQTRGETAYV